MSNSISGFNFNDNSREEFNLTPFDTSFNTKRTADHLGKRAAEQLENQNKIGSSPQPLNSKRVKSKHQEHAHSPNPSSVNTKTPEENIPSSSRINSNNISTDSPSSSLLELCKTKNYVMIHQNPEFIQRCQEKDFIQKCLMMRSENQLSFTRNDFNNLISNVINSENFKITYISSGKTLNSRQIKSFIDTALNDYAIKVFVNETLEKAGISQNDGLIELCKNNKLADIAHTNEYLSRTHDFDFRIKCLEPYIKNSSSPKISEREQRKLLLANFDKFKECFKKSNYLYSICNEFNKETGLNLDLYVCRNLFLQSVRKYGPQIFATEVLENNKKILMEKEKEKEKEIDKQKEEMLFEFLNDDNTNEFPFSREEELNL